MDVRVAHLDGLVGEFHFDFGALGAEPEEDLLSVVEQHDVLVGQVVLTKVGALFRDGEEAAVVGAPEQADVVQKVGLRVVGLALAQRHPEEVVRLLALVEHLQTETVLRRPTIQHQHSVLVVDMGRHHATTIPSKVHNQPFRGVCFLG